jgi:hypothetical protein
MVYMPKNTNYELLEKVKEYLRLESLKAGGGEISPPLAQIAVALGEVGPTGKPYSEKILRNINSLERMGIIKIFKGKGSQGNSYLFLKDSASALVEEAKDEHMNEFETYVDEFNMAAKKMISFSSSQTKKIIELQGEINYYKSLLAELEYASTWSDGKTIFTTKSRNSRLPEIIADIREEFAKANEKDKLTDGLNDFNNESNNETNNEESATLETPEAI